MISGSRFRYVIISAFLLVMSASVNTQAQSQVVPENGGKHGAVRIFLDVSRRYEEYLKLEIPYVNYVRDRKLADVHVMMMEQRTGSGGTEHTITLAGLGEYTAFRDTLVYMSQQMDTEEITRAGIKQALQMGLVPVVKDTPQARDIEIVYTAQEGDIAAHEDVVDKWNYWVFNINTNTRLNGEESRKNTWLRGSFSADRVTPEWKTSFSVSADYNKDEYETDDGWIDSQRRSQDLNALVVKSITDHWSVGGFAEGESSTFRNLDLTYSIAPAIEFNVFPYSESAYREFRFLYRMAYEHVDYVEETIFSKREESLFREIFSATYEIKEQWGSIQTTLEGSHYFHDTAKNRIQLDGNFNIRLFEGMSLDVRGNISQIHDQLSLPASDASDEEILLEQRELATSYDYFVSIGLRYTFGSIYSNVVNPRFNTNNRR